MKLRPEDLPPGAYRDAHSWDLSEPLQRLKDVIDITIIGCQPKRVTSNEFELGLTEEVEEAIPKTVRIVLEEIGVEYGAAINHQGTHLWAPGETSGETGKTTGE